MSNLRELSYPVLTRHDFPIPSQVVLEDSFEGHHGPDLFDPEKVSYRTFRVKKSATLREMMELFSETLVSRNGTGDGELGDGELGRRGPVILVIGSPSQPM